MLPLLILPGWASDVKRWQPLTGMLRQQKVSVQLIKVPYDRVRNTADFCFWLKNKTKNIRNFYLLGHSFGGQIAINFTAVYPGKVKKLILVNSAGIRKKVNIKRWLVTPLAQLSKTLIPDEYKSFFYRLLQATDYQRSTPVMKQILRKIITEDQQKNLSQIHCQTLLIWGKDYRLTPLADGRLMHQLIMNSRLQIISGRHGLPFTHPKTLSRIVINFIKA